ncbi:hypothetical protein VFPBJ_11262 [Purpureocillium lilacinum]|uniref:Uncharacterized protein n=1 Tax=Purpureocillium lilacinum TaxID=33203 RepID=A0A179FES7_PURLI|nr:hypothetical protein VFPBJ_11262 [Purpureocillium lilacinum]
MLGRVYGACHHFIRQLRRREHQIDRALALRALPRLRAPWQQAAEAMLAHEVDDGLTFALPSRRNFIPAPEEVVAVEIACQHHVRTPAGPITEFSDQAIQERHRGRQRLVIVPFHVYRHHQYVPCGQSKHRGREVGRLDGHLFCLNVTSDPQQAPDRPRSVVCACWYHLRPVPVSYRARCHPAIHRASVRFRDRYHSKFLQVAVIHQTQLYWLLLSHVELQDAQALMHCCLGSSPGISK